MRTVIQRVSRASVKIEERIHASIANGLLVLAGIEEADTIEDAEWLTRKIVQLRIFSDEDGLMNKSVKDIDGDILIVSQFTLFAATKKGNRPSFIRAARPETAVPLYEKFVAMVGVELGKVPATGSFGADMQVELLNNGPVTIIIDSKARE